TNNEKALLLATTLDEAIEQYLNNNKSPSRKVNEIDNRGSHFYLTLYWAQILAAQNDDTEMKERFTELAKTLTDDETKIYQDLIEVQGKQVDLHGYYHPDDELATKMMRPSKIFNDALDAL
ncbi:MAG: NADP-dependent isocitrate dehydrogenase, partial [Promethearchaeota archaeon]